MRRFILPVVAVALVAHAFAAYGVWRAGRDPARSGRWTGAHFEALKEQAEIELQAALASLSDRSRPPADRLAGYRAQLDVARGLLVRSLEVNPAQPDALATLATIDHERAPHDAATREAVLYKIEIAAGLAPRVPSVQAQLGELLMRMGQPAEGLHYLARSAELDDEFADRAVRLASLYGVTAEEIGERLPLRAASLAALRQACRTEDLPGYLVKVENAVAGGDVEPTETLMLAYSDAALSAGAARRLADVSGTWGPFADPRLEGVRLMLRGRAALALGDAGQAFSYAQEGQGLDPESHRLANFLGDAARAAKRPEEAIRAYRHGLGLLARRNAVPEARAFVYRRIGEAQEDRMRLDLAYDAYAKALELNPDEPHARRRALALAGYGGS